MRLARLELTRYGGYEGRGLDFGDGRPDLHLIIGPNEAGKSTLLSAIGDLLFGIPRQTAQDWRFESKDLRLAATLMHGGGVLEVVRRSGLKNALLGANGAPIAEETLRAMIGGLDRSAFDRLFGLDHARLRAGGQAMLAGKDDAAQSLFEAGAGMAAVGVKLKRLQAECDEMFKPSASKPTLNRLLRERHEATDLLRGTTIGEADWTALRDRRARAEKAKADLIGEDQTLTAEIHRLERLARARAPLRRLTQARGELAGLGPLPSLPEDAAQRLAAARAERATAAELRNARQIKRDRAIADIDAITLPDTILAEAPRIDALEARRPEIDRMRKDLPGKAASLEAIDGALATAREVSGLAIGARLPTPAWRRRARKHLEDRRALSIRMGNHAEALRENQSERRKAGDDLAKSPEPASLRDLREALTALSMDAIARLDASHAAAGRAATRAESALAALGWAGTPDALASAVLPSVAEAAEYEERGRQAREALTKAREAGEAAEAEGLSLRARLDGLTAGGLLPTPEVVAAGRDRRNEAVRDVTARLSRDRRPDDPEAASRLALAIGEADLLADRRDADSRQIAEHALVAASLTVVAGTGLAARQTIARASEDQSRALADWSKVLARAGLPDTLLPSGFPAWRDARDRFLQLNEDALAAAHEHGLALTTLALAETRLSAAMAESGAAIDGDRAARIRAAGLQVEALEALSRMRLGLEVRLTELARAEDMLGREADAIGRRTRELDEEHARLMNEAGLADLTTPALEDALDALDEVAPREGARPGLLRDVEGMTRDIAQFDTAALALLCEIGRSGNNGAMSEEMGRLAAEVETARDARRTLQRLRGLVAEETDAISGDVARGDAAQMVIDQLVARAGVGGEEALDSLLAVIARAMAAMTAEAEALSELTEIGPGAGDDDLAKVASELDEDSATALRRSKEDRRREITAEREEIGGELKDVLLTIDRAGENAEAADARQVLTETEAALGAAAERFIETAGAAALLRWLIERYRAEAQAPLLRRAGSLFASVTSGAFDGLALDYGDDDRPRIVAVRADGTRVGIEGLSEGARDQLFLALRLGALQGRADAPPLVCDDLLITSDDERAGAVLGVLRRMSETQQVLVFTHHDHIEAVAQRALGPGGFQLHRLPKITTPSVAFAAASPS